MKRLVGCVLLLVAGLVGHGHSLAQEVPRGTLVFSEYISGVAQGIYLMDLPGGAVTQVMPSNAYGYPKWSPDGQWIAFSGGASGNSQIYVVRPDGTALRRVTDGSGDSYHPSFSPDGTRIAFAQVYGNLFIINFDGTNLTNLGVRASDPEWSPDGTKIAYSNWANGGGYNSDLFVYDLTTQTQTQITHHAPGEAFNLAVWSPDSRYLAVWKVSADGPGDVWRMNSDGGNPVNLTAYLVGGWYPGCWLPDGEYFFFFGAETGYSDLWVMKADGSGRNRLTNTPLVSESLMSFKPAPDTTPPVARCTTNKSVLQPPNHQVEQVTVYVQASDNLTPTPKLKVAAWVSSNERDDARGDGHFTGDVNGQDGFTLPVPFNVAYDPATGFFVGTVNMRAERDGTRADRVYSVLCAVTDLAGNSTIASCTVVVPHDRGKN